MKSQSLFSLVDNLHDINAYFQGKISQKKHIVFDPITAPCAQVLHNYWANLR